MKVWSWRHAIQKSELPSTTKLVLFNLSIYMNEQGQGCYPSTRQQALDTGLTERSICTHIDLAVTAGFLVKTRHGYGHQKWARNEYVAAMPGEDEIGGQPPDPEPPDEGEEALKEVQRLDSETAKKALNVVQEGTEPDDKKALNDVQCNTPLNSSGITSGEKAAPLHADDPPTSPRQSREALDAQLWFHGGTIRLTKPDYFRLQESSGRSDEEFWEWLKDRDRWYELQPQQVRKQWFLPTQVEAGKMGKKLTGGKNGFKKAR